MRGGPSPDDRHVGLTQRLCSAAGALLETAATSGWRGPDAYDGLYARWPALVVGGRRRRQAVVQLHARAPIDVRRLYGRRRHPRIAKTLGVFGSVGVRLHRLTENDRFLLRGVDALDALTDDHQAGPRAWGYPFDVQTRWSFYPAGTPNVVVSSFAARALLESGHSTHMARARTAARWALDELWSPTDRVFVYHSGSRAVIHNANLLGAALVHEALGSDSGVRERVAQSVDRSLAAQAPDGSFPYGDGPGLEWEDSFHTGYVLLCLATMRSVDPSVGDALARGARAYERFFDTTGRALLWRERSYPEDAHAAGTGLSALSALFGTGLVDRGVLERVSERALTAGLHRGRAVARRYRWGRTTVRYLRWCDAHLALGFVDAAVALKDDCGADRDARP